jgi:CRISPR-associated protein Cmr1
MISFPRAAFGLPIIFDFNVPSEVGEPATTELKPKHSERLASPLILKPMAVGDSQYAPIALLLPVSHLDTLTLKLMQGNSKLKELPRNSWWPLDATIQENAAKDISPMNGRGTDALNAFMKYFET